MLVIERNCFASFACNDVKKIENVKKDVLTFAHHKSNQRTKRMGKRGLHANKARGMVAKSNAQKLTPNKTLKRVNATRTRKGPRCMGGRRG